MKTRIQGAIFMAMVFFAGSSGSCEEPKQLPKATTNVPTTQAAGPTATAVFAGGCFWCTEAVFEQLSGVSDVVSGYAGDTEANANYEAVCSGTTNHAEAIRITYDPSKIEYGELLRVFFSSHDPTTKDRQGPDFGRQYRSAIFYANDEQKQIAEGYIKQLTDAKVFKEPIVTTLEPLGKGFFPAEQYHQNFVQCHPNHPYILQQALPKVEKVRKAFPDEVKK
ncbi:MAG TPA: peptide-methionine (S)-S-oxide reductase MsrA [Tepidisphaeraceae bacterium]